MTHRVSSLVFAFLVYLTSGCGSEASPAREQAPALQAASREDLAVYAAVLDSLYAHDERVDTLLVHRFTTEILSAFEEKPSSASVRTRLALLEGAPSDAVEDYLRVNSESAEIRDSIPLERRYRLTSPSSDGPIANAPVPYSFEFSRVGYSAARDYAIVTIAFHCLICGEGQSVLLARHGSAWRVVATSVNWVS